MQKHRTRSSASSSNQRRIPLFSLYLAMHLLILLAQPVHAAGWLGITIQEHVPEDWAIKGIKVVGVDAEGPASRAGIRPGDVILSVDGTPVQSSAELAKAMRGAGSGRSIQMTVFREGRMLNFSLALAEPPLYLTLYQQGLELAEKKRYDEALGAFTKALNLNPKHAETYRSRANVYMEKKQFDAAIADYTKYIEFDSKSAQIFHNRGRAYGAKKLYDQAISDYSKGIEIDPRAASLYLDRGVAYSMKKLDNEAIQDYSRAIEIDPKLVPAYEFRGAAYTAKKQKDLAEADYKTAARLSLEGGMEFASKGEDDKAIRAFTWGIRHETEYAYVIYYERGLVYEKKGDYARAASDYGEAIRRNPNYGQAYRQRGTLYAEKMGDRKRAERDWQKAAELGQATTGVTAASRLVCPSPIFGKLLWKAGNPECPEGFMLLPGSRFRQNTPWVCARCPENCSFVEEPDKTFICASTGSTTRGTAPADSSESRPSGDTLLGQQWRSSDDRQESKATPPPSPHGQVPRTESEVRLTLENMGFKIIEKATFGPLSGYYIEITNPARAAQFGFKEYRRTVAGRGVTGMIGCWTEQKGDGQIIWIDWRDVEIKDDSKLPPYVKLYRK
ncbi:MAG: tetratricopeptide repeat protein [candidate division WOR-3 bacterium]